MIWINRFFEINLNVTKSTWIYWFWHFSMQNFFITNRFKYIESKKSIDFIIYNQYKIFDIFVRIFRNENTISHETHFEQWIRINLIFSKIENANITKKLRIINLTNNKFDEHTICSTNVQQIWRTCNKFDKFAINCKHAMNSKLNKKSFNSFIYFLSKNN